jgi:putative phosphonate metabolism protein
MTARYAIYFCPATGTALHRFGTSWLGRDPAIEGPEIAPEGLPADEWRRITLDARRYGFHATLKPPFALASGSSRIDLVLAVTELARTLRAVQLPPLQLAIIDRFLALTPRVEQPQISALAERCVVGLDRFRRPAQPEELARRRRAKLTPRQDDLLKKYGYSYVLEEFRFHMTLTDRLDDITAGAVRRLLEPRLESALAEPARIIDLCLFEEAGSGAPFVLTERFPLGL